MTTIVAGLSRRRPIRLGEVAERAIAILLLVGVAVWFVANMVKAPSQTLNTLIDGLNNGAVYALIALGYTLVYGIIELINFAHGDLFMLGTVLCANMMVKWLGLEKTNLEGFLGLALTMIVVMIFCAAINVSAELLAYRRLRNAPKLAPLITAVGLSFVFQNLGQLWNGSGQKPWNTVFNDSGFSIGDVQITYSFLVVIGATAVLLLGLTFIVQKTRRGKAMRAVAQDQDGARLMGINVNATISFTFALGGPIVAGAAATLYMETNGITRYDAGFRLGLFAFTAAVLGGIGNLLGAVIGGIIIGLVEGLNGGAPYGFGSKWVETVVFGILILVMVFKPEGLLGRRTTEKV